MNLKTVSAAVIAALAFSGAHGLLHGEPRIDPGRLARDLSRPFVMPGLWNRIEAARRMGDLLAAATLGRDLIRYLPDWADGHVHFAAWLAFDADSDSGTRAVDRLDTALAWLDEAKAELAARDPQRAADIAATQATFVQVRAQQDPEIERAIRARSGLDSSEVALTYLDEAIELADVDTALRERRAVLLVRVIAAAIRVDDLPRAIATLDIAISLLSELRDPEAAKPWIEALGRIRPILTGEEVELDPHRADPYLEDLIRALESR